MRSACCRHLWSRACCTMSSATSESGIASARKKIQPGSQRRQNKPLIEKRRRARINECLLQLKGLLMKDMGKESPRPSKLEKADILEMTVDYIKKIADKKPDVSTSEGKEPFLHGFSRCLQEVDSFLDRQLPRQPQLRHSLLQHCKGQLAPRDATTLQRDATRDQPSRFVDPDSSDSDVKVNLTTGFHGDSGSETSGDEERGSCVDSDDVKSPPPSSTVQAAASVISLADSDSSAALQSTITTTTTAAGTALAAPRQHSSDSPSPSSCSQSPVSSQQTDGGSGGDRSNGGIKLAGPLKLICGGNVFIVVDQHQPSGDGKPADSGPLPVVSAAPSSGGGGHLVYSPAVGTIPGGGMATYIPSLSPPHLSLGGYVSLPPAPSLPLVSPAALSSSLTQAVDKLSVAPALPFLHYGTVTTTTTVPGQSPFPPPASEVTQQAGHDVNNNVLNVANQLAGSPVWRPW